MWPDASSSLSEVRRAIVALLLVALGGCDGERDETSAEPASSEAAAEASGTAALAGVVLPPERAPVVNPLELPVPLDPAPVAVEQLVFAVPQRMLERARLGSAMALRVATVEAVEGDNLVVRTGADAPYVIHRAYVVVPRLGQLQRGSYVVAGYSGELHHAVVKNLVGDKVLVRFTDVGFKLPDQKVEPKRLGVLGAGLRPGGYAAHLADQEYRHVLLVSSSPGEGGKRRWLVIGYGGATALVAEDKLRPLPEPRFSPRAGATVLAAWRGTMVRAQLVSVDDLGLYTVARARAGAPLLVDAGMIMPSE
jgi:hypothetical protein